MTTNDAKTNDGLDSVDLLATLEIRKVERLNRFGGAWVTGRKAGEAAAG